MSFHRIEKFISFFEPFPNTDTDRGLSKYFSRSSDVEKLTGMTEREMIMINFLTRRSIERIIVVDRMRVHVDEDLDNEDVMAWY